MKTPEAFLKDDIIKELRKMRPTSYIFKPVQTGYGRRTVDILCCINGRFVGIEVKREGEKPTPLQERCLQEIIAAGGAAFWCDTLESFMLNMTTWGLIK